MTSTQQTGLSSSRVHDRNSVDLALLKCFICHELLWKPVACQICETPYCSTCITHWLIKNPTKCPNRCRAYTERKCPTMVVKLLAQLQITCFYRSNGCQKIVPYEVLDKHEIDCDYRFQQCTNCHSQILKKDLNNHQKNCTSLKLICQDCQLVYERDGTAAKHTESICLREQLRQVREESKENKRVIQELTRQLRDESNENKRLIWELTQKLSEICASKNCTSAEVTIKFDDLPSAKEGLRWLPAIYKRLKWSEIAYGHKSHLKENNPTSGYITCFTDDDNPHTAFFKEKASISVQQKNEMFTLVSLNACAAWRDSLQLTITGYQRSLQTKTYSMTLAFGKIQTILLLWTDIDEVVFKSSGGTAHPGSNGDAGSQVILTQLIVRTSSE